MNADALTSRGGAVRLHKGMKEGTLREMDRSDSRVWWSSEGGGGSKRLVASHQGNYYLNAKSCRRQRF